ncbi:hypothetical protein [Tissierella sp. Yu-01]|uniref:hypothetical protein n=1 Tax=Tissierella sp. Yu-01 TaxID=3035694 RepID=UPI00240E6A0F|nr:hypothetical protein [Tissierella sp. Yu-01]WFA10293.1 hypothetical protein P3962_07015 [Tissierella sp. Yu-01]
MKTRLILIIIIISNLYLTGCNEYSKEEKDLLDFIENFLNIQYEAYVRLEYIDIESFLDMSTIQNKNKVTALKKIIIQRKHVEDMKYALVNKHKYPFEIIVHDININGEYASLKIDLELEKNKDYPKFISKGLNRFILKIVDNTWEIVYHDYEGLTLFETSNNTLLPDIDEERIRRVIDNEYVTPFS